MKSPADWRGLNWRAWLGLAGSGTRVERQPKTEEAAARVEWCERKLSFERKRQAAMCGDGAKGGRLIVKWAQSLLELTPLVVWYENVLEYRPNLLRHNQ